MPSRKKPEKQDEKEPAKKESAKKKPVEKKKKKKKRASTKGRKLVRWDGMLLFHLSSQLFLTLYCSSSASFTAPSYDYQHSSLLDLARSILPCHLSISIYIKTMF